MTDGRPYPELPDLTAPATYDSVKQVGFQYNQCNVIRFMPDAAIGNQQYMKYADVVVDMKLPNKKWAFRSAPVEGMISGDLYMANADLNNETPLWEVSEFDADGRTYKTGNGSFWLSVYNTETKKINATGADSTRTASADWSKVTNAIDLPLKAGQGLAIYARTKEGIETPIVRLPKDDDTYYFYGTYGERIDDKYVGRLRDKRNELASPNEVGDLTFHPDGANAEYTLTNGNDENGNPISDTVFVFGNPTMGYIDIWGFIDDNSLRRRFDFMDERPSGASLYTSVSRAAAEATDNVITNPLRYLPPMRAIVLKKDAATSLTLRLNTSRVVTSPGSRPASAPRRVSASGLTRGIMTVTAKNPCSPRCTSRLLIGQGYHNAIRDGEDAVLTTINIDNYSNTNAPATPFNMYAAEGSYGLSIDLRDSIVNIPVSFLISELPYDPVTYLWFTGVNNIDGELVLYDAQTDTEREIIDGIYLTIETPTQSHERRYYIRRRGYKEQSGTEIATDVEIIEPADDEQIVKFIKNDKVYILRRGQIYTILGQRVQ